MTPLQTLGFLLGASQGAHQRRAGKCKGANVQEYKS
jgi:hypothetical protein